MPIFYHLFSPALGLGWRLGFLGLLHLDVFNQRLEQEYNAQAIMTAPSVTYRGDIFSFNLFFLSSIDYYLYAKYFSQDNIKKIN